MYVYIYVGVGGDTSANIIYRLQNGQLNGLNPDKLK